MNDLRVALLRGINVGGHRKLPMADLRALCADLGWSDVKTYIQSGNVVFRSPGSEAEAEAALMRAIADRFGYDVPVMVRSHDALVAAQAANPYPDALKTPKFLHVVFLSSEPSPQAIEAFDTSRFERERLTVDGDRLYVHYRDGAGRSKLTLDWLERQLGVRATGRNARTLAKLVELSRTP